MSAKNIGVSLHVSLKGGGGGVNLKNFFSLSCGLFKMVRKIRKMISRSVCQGCTGFPYLVPLMCYYVATADINQAAAYMHQFMMMSMMRGSYRMLRK